MAKLTFFMTLVSIYSYWVMAAGTMQLEGKVVNVNETHIEVDDNYHIYSLNRQKISSIKKISQLKSGDSFNFSVSFDAIDKTKTNVKK